MKEKKQRRGCWMLNEEVVSAIEKLSDPFSQPYEIRFC